MNRSLWRVANQALRERAAAGLAGGALPRRRTTGESVLGAAGLRLGWGLAVEVASGMRNPLVVLWR